MSRGVWGTGRLTRLVVGLSLGLAIGSIAVAQPADDDAGNAAGGSGTGWGVFAGFITGDEVTNQSIDGRRPELDDSASFGGLFYLKTTENWALEFRVGTSSTEMLDTVYEIDGTEQEGPVDTTLYYVEVALHPSWRKGNFEYGFPFGIGWAWTDAEQDFTGDIPERPGLDDAVEDGDGASLFYGVQVRWYIKDRWSLFAEGRVHRFQDLADRLEEEAVMPEFVVGFMRHM